MPMVKSRPTMRRPARALLLRRNRFQAPSRMLHARVGGGVEQVREESRGERQQSREQAQPENHWIVAGENRVEVKPPEARPRKDLLDDDGPREKAGQEEAERSRQRQEGVAKRVAPERLRARGSARSSRQHVVHGGG